MRQLFLILSSFFTITTIHAQVGIGTTTPGTTLDVNGAITNREINVAVSANAATVPANTSMVRLTGAATSTISITVPAPPNAGQRLIIYNNTTGGYSAEINSVSIPNGKANEFVYSNGNWQGLSPNVQAAATIIPYASGLPVTVNTLLTGLASTGAIIGFGSSVSGISLTAADIDITGGTGINTNFGFTAPRGGTIKSISGFFSVSAGVNLLGASVTVKAHLYKSSSINSNIFTQVPGAEVTIGTPYTALVTVGSTRSGILSGLNIPFNAQDRFLLVFYSNSNSVITTLNGYASAGIAIE
jgi:BclB C-terminal domain-containing protein